MGGLQAILIVPLVGAALGLVLRSRGIRILVLVLSSALHLALVTRLWFAGAPPPPLFDGHLALDPLGHLFLTVSSAVFLAISIYNVQYRHFTPRTSRTFLVPLNLVMLAAMSVMTTARHLGLVWLASSAMTLTVVPLIYLDRGRRTLEAAWKYLILCSVGVAFALLGIFFVAIAATSPSGAGLRGLVIDDLLELAREGRLATDWLRAAFIFVLVGFGTKVGLAPMHTWKPDTYGEAPVPLAALMATALTNCAFLGIMRCYQVCLAAGEGQFAGSLLVVLGLVSMATSAAFVVGQTDVKRLLAYSGVEHMGVIALGVGIGGKAAYGAMLHLVGHSLAKGTLFFAAGNLAIAYRTQSIAGVSGAIRRMPVSGVLLLAGFIGTLGLPPFSIFVSELTILGGALRAGRGVVAALFLAFLMIVFTAVLALVQKMVFGPDPRGEGAARQREPVLLAGPPLALLALCLAIGVWVPPALDSALAGAAALIGG